MTPYAQSAFAAAQARCQFQLATDEVMHMLQFSRDGGPHPTPFFVYHSAPLPLEPGSIITDDDAERIAAQAEGARMAMGNQAPSAPMPLDENGKLPWWRRLAPLRGSFWEGVEMSPVFAVLAVVATVAAVAALR